MITHRRERAGWPTLALLLATPLAAAPLGSAFTWQGQLREAGALASGLYDFQFCLFDSAIAAQPLACAPDFADIPVESGVFSVALDFGAAVFDGQQRFLELRVRPGASAGAYTILSPRQLIRPAPEALRARRADQAVSADVSGSAPWTGLTGVPAGFADGVDNTGVSSISAGSGLSGGTITGSGTLAVDTSQIQARVTGTCANGSSLRQVNADGSVACLPHVAAVAAGPGISSSFSNGTATVGLSPGGVGLAQIDTTQVQARIAAGCEEGHYLRAVNADGSVVCEPLAIDINRIRALTNGGAQASLGLSLAIRNDRALIAFRNAGSQLALYRCANPGCSSGSLVNLEAGGNAPSMVLRGDGRPLIAHHVPASDDLRLYDCADADCTSGVGTTLDASGFVGRSPQVALRPDGRPLVSYYDFSLTSLKLYDCANPQCSSGAIRILDGNNDPGGTSALAVRADGRALIAYGVNNTEDLRLYRCANVDCSSGSSLLLDGALDAAGGFPSIRLRANGRPLIAYAARETTELRLRVYDCNEADCSSGTVRPVLTVPGTSTGAYSSIAIRPDGRALISFRQVTNPQLAILDCADSGCSSGTAVGLDGNGNPAFFTSIGLRSDGRALIAYGNDDGNLRLFVCGSGSCR